MKTKEELDKLLTNVIVHCKTEKEANNILFLADKLGYCWGDGDNFNQITEYNIYKEDTCYNIVKGIYTSLTNHKPEYIVISADSFIGLIYNKYPYYKTNQKEWDTIIKPKLEEFGYNIEEIEDFNNAPNIVYISECDCITNMIRKDPYSCRLKEITNLDEYLTFMGLIKGIKYIKDTKMETKNFIKADLKSGMIVVTRNTDTFIVVDDLLIDNSGFIYLESYNDNLEINHNHNYDIVEIYDKSNAWDRGFNSDYAKGKLLWKRVDKIKMTIQEIEEKLGLDKGSLFITLP